MRKKLRTPTIVCALLLGLLALSNVFGAVRLTGRLDVIYLAFALAGVIGSVLGFLKYKLAYLLLMAFFLLQSVFVYGNNFIFKLSPGLALPVGWLSKGMEEAVLNQKGIAVNLIGVALLFLCWYSVKPHSQMES